MHIIADAKRRIYSGKKSNGSKEKKYMRLDSIDNVAEIRYILSSPHLLLDDTFRALTVTTYAVSQHKADARRGLNPIFYASRLWDCNCYLGYRWRSRSD